MISTVRRDGYVIVQEFLPAVAKGDKRVLLLGGAPLRVGDTVAAYKRMRPRDDIRNNMHVGGARRRADFSEAEQRICDLLRPRLTADGLYLVGVDLVGDKILEINVYAPGGIHNINELYDIDVGTAVIRDLERKVELRARVPRRHPVARLHAHLARRVRARGRRSLALRARIGQDSAARRSGARARSPCGLASGQYSDCAARGGYARSPCGLASSVRASQAAANRTSRQACAPWAAARTPPGGGLALREVCGQSPRRRVASVRS